MISIHYRNCKHLLYQTLEKLPPEYRLAFELNRLENKSIEEIAEIISRVELKEKIGVCLDTCHVYDAGYDIVNDLDGVLEEFDRIIGLDRLHAIHLNDSKNPFNSHKDRHEKIGEGSLGLEGISRIINHPKLKHLPFFLETPNELDGYKNEIEVLRKEYIED